MRRELPAPIRGVTDAQPFIKTPGDAVPYGNLENFRPDEDSTGRRRLTTRPGIEEPISGTLSGEVQDGGVVPKASGIVDYDRGDSTELRGGQTRSAGLLRAQCVLLDADWSVLASFNETAGVNTGTWTLKTPPPTNYGGAGAFNCCWDPDNDDVGFFLCILKDTTKSGGADKYICSITRIHVPTRAITHTGYVQDGQNNGSGVVLDASPEDLFANSITCFGPYLFLTVNGLIYVFRKDNLQYLRRQDGGWVQEYQAARCVTIGGRDFLLTGMIGTSYIGGPVVNDTSIDPKEAFGEFVRSGIELWEIGYADASLKTPKAQGVNVLTRIPMPQGTESGDGAYENHRYFRPSEWSKARPRGCLIYDIDVDPATGDVFIARTNQGFGYDPITNNPPQRPDGVGPYISACRAVLERAYSASPPAYIDPATEPDTYGFSSPGWETDFASHRRAYTWGGIGSPVFNDIPPLVAGTREPQTDVWAPSSYAVRYDPGFDRVLFAGRRTSDAIAKPNVHCHRGSDGALMWEADLRGLINQNAIDVDPSGHWVVGKNRSDWPGTGLVGPAEVVMLDRESGAVRRTFDLTDAVNFNGRISGSSVIGCEDVAVNGRGQVLVALAPFRYDVP